MTVEDALEFLKIYQRYEESSKLYDVGLDI